jgi:DNA-binding XRE family transcriptional regulator
LAIKPTVTAKKEEITKPFIIVVWLSSTSNIHNSDYSPWIQGKIYLTFVKTKVRMMIVKVFGQVLRELRVSKKLSQEKLAELTDLDRTYISLLERGQRQPSLTTIFKVSIALGIRPSDLVEKVQDRTIE